MNMKYFHLENVSEDFRKRLSIYTRSHLGGSLMCKFKEDSSWKIVLTEDHVSAIEESLENNLKNATSNGAIASLTRSVSCFNEVKEALKPLSLSKITERVYTRVGEKGGKRSMDIYSNYTGSGYKGICIIKHLPKPNTSSVQINFSISVDVSIDGKFQKKSVYIGRCRSLEYSLKELLYYRCDMLGIKRPESIDYTKSLKTLDNMGYKEQMGNKDDKIIEFNYSLRRKKPKRKNKVIEEKTGFSNTGYRNIKITLTNNNIKKNNGKKNIVVGYSRREGERMLTKAWLLKDMEHYKEVLKEALKHREEDKGEMMPKDINFETGLKSLDEIVKKNKVDFYFNQLRSNTSSTGYTQIMVRKHGFKIYVSLKFGDYGQPNFYKEEVALDNSFNYKEILTKLIRIRCKKLNIKMPKDIDFETGLKLVKAWGKEIESEILLSNNSNTGYKGIAIKLYKACLYVICPSMNYNRRVYDFKDIKKNLKELADLRFNSLGFKGKYSTKFKIDYQQAEDTYRNFTSK